MKQATITVAQGDNGLIAVTVKGGNEDGSDEIITFDPMKAHQSNREYAEFHGWKQRLVDTAAMSKDTKTGLPATPAEKVEAIRAIVAHYESGTDKWSRVSEGGPKGGYLFEALCKVYGHKKAPSEIRTWLDGLDDKQQAALREDDTIAPVIAEIKAAKAKAKPESERVDTKALLANI
jgi:hypothetical protein